LNKTKVGENIRRIINNRGITITRLADDIDENMITVSRYVNGDRSPRVEILKKIADYLGVSTDYLINTENGEDVEYVGTVVESDLAVKFKNNIGKTSISDAIKWFVYYVANEQIEIGKDLNLGE